MASIADYFGGVVTVRRHSQVVNLEMIPNVVIIDGVKNVTGYTRNLYTGDFETRTYVFEGVPAAMADALTGSVTVLDVGGKSHVVSFANYVTDGSSGTAVFEKDSNAVVVSRMSPHMRRVEVTRTVASLKCNGAVVVAAPNW